TAVLDGFAITAGHANGALPNDLDGMGGGLSLSNSSPMIAHVTFCANAAISGGGMANTLPSSPTLSYIIFCGNVASASSGGLLNLGSPSKLTNVIFSGNRANYGGGMFNYLSHPIVNQATFFGNIAMDSNGGGGMWNGYINSSPTVRDSIFWGNSGGQIVTSQGTPDVRYTLIQGGYISGTNILDADPRFVDPNGTDNSIGTPDDNLHLQPSSPAIDAGDNASIPADTIDADNDGNRSEPAPFDLDGRSRVVNGIVDMGVYEWSIVTSLSPPSPVTYGDTYSYTMLANDPSATFGVAAGELPPGLSLAPPGLLSGTLTAAGSYTATIIISGTFAVATQTVAIDVDKAPLTVRANDTSRLINAPNPSFSASYSGFVNGDTPTSLAGTLTFATTATLNSPAGNYPIHPAGLSSPNYTITFADGVLTVGSHTIYLPLLRR
ncbi:MAG: MBG domain-containing protein, partial [Roseiflexaceae bacterium]